MGGSKSKPGIHIQLDKQFYLPGDTVSGNVYVNAQQAYPATKIVLHISGLEKTWWRHSNDNQNNQTGSVASSGSMNNLNSVNGQKKVPIGGDRFGECKIIDASFAMTSWGNGKTNKLHGQFTFPFEFRLPNYVPGSFKEEKSNFKASVIYQVKCHIVADGKAEDVIATQQLIIREPRKNNEEVLYGETYIYPQTCFCRKNGVSKVTCYFEKNQYLPGQQCIAICQADNYKCRLKIKQIKVKFKKVVTLTSGFGQEKKFFQEINTASFPGVAAHGQYTGEQAKKISLPLKYRDSKSSVHPTTNGRLVKCHYYLQVSPDLSGWYLKNVGTFQVELNILHEAQALVQIQEPENWNPQVERKSQIVLGQNFSNEFIDDMGNKNYF